LYVRTITSAAGCRAVFSAAFRRAFTIETVRPERCRFATDAGSSLPEISGSSRRPTVGRFRCRPCPHVAIHRVRPRNSRFSNAVSSAPTNDRTPLPSSPDSDPRPFPRFRRSDVCAASPYPPPPATSTTRFRPIMTVRAPRRPYPHRSVFRFDIGGLRRPDTPCASRRPRPGGSDDTRMRREEIRRDD